MQTPLRLIILVLFTAVIALPWKPAQAQDPLRIATEGAYPPFNEVDKDGKLVGFDVDIAMALCEAMGTTCTLESVAWDNLLPELNAGKFDVIVASMAKTPEREEHAIFTDYYYRSRSMFVGTPSTLFFQTREGVKGMKLAAQEGTVQEQYLRDNFEGSASIVTAPDMKDCFDMLHKGEVDAVLSDSLTIFDFLQSDKGKRFDFIGNPLPADDPSSEACIAVAKSKPQLAAQINSALREIRFNGTYDRINLKYFPFSIY
ncbi:transporter substrate-binding domain-containing protein [Pseudodesulfovibrio sp. zrk46]|uniref:transporter substrate-binding domain-containing protein n=1 Tax=Pseudodesulfovibrio sp. zrk46 TaxID=2725288 RepID=UPI001449748D|nr:transporter substrate-binding domain-containing protein [Pseudodesulfovibrio sp. zrk46]QJB55006.1 transporter substrate-binding domain-containing protein [Pseudodesulfovibrio sp. zrk46]